jgi:hypothetical protein
MGTTQRLKQWTNDPENADQQQRSNVLGFQPKLLSVEQRLVMCSPGSNSHCIVHSDYRDRRRADASEVNQLAEL